MLFSRSWCYEGKKNIEYKDYGIEIIEAICYSLNSTETLITTIKFLVLELKIDFYKAMKGMDIEN